MNMQKIFGQLHPHAKFGYSIRSVKLLKDSDSCMNMLDIFGQLHPNAKFGYKLWIF